MAASNRGRIRSPAVAAFTGLTHDQVSTVACINIGPSATSPYYSIHCNQPSPQSQTSLHIQQSLQVSRRSEPQWFNSSSAPGVSRSPEPLHRKHNVVTKLVEETGQWLGTGRVDYSPGREPPFCSDTLPLRLNVPATPLSSPLHLSELLLHHRDTTQSKTHNSAQSLQQVTSSHHSSGQSPQNPQSQHHQRETSRGRSSREITLPGMLSKSTPKLSLHSPKTPRGWTTHTLSNPDEDIAATAAERSNYVSNN